MTPAALPATAIRALPAARPTRRVSLVTSFAPATSRLFHAWRP